jgi:hypothetical protein
MTRIEELRKRLDALHTIAAHASDDESARIYSRRIDEVAREIVSLEKDAEKRGRDQERSVEPAPNYEGACCSLEQARSQYMKWQPNGVPQTFVDFVKSEARKIDPGVI